MHKIKAKKQTAYCTFFCLFFYFVIYLLCAARSWPHKRASISQWLKTQFLCLLGFVWSFMLFDFIYMYLYKYMYSSMFNVNLIKAKFRIVVRYLAFGVAEFSCQSQRSRLSLIGRGMGEKLIFSSSASWCVDSTACLFSSAWGNTTVIILNLQDLAGLLANVVRKFVRTFAFEEIINL